MKGQITVFFLIGLVLLIIVMLLVYSQNQTEPEIIVEERELAPYMEWGPAILLEEAL